MGTENFKKKKRKKKGTGPDLMKRQQEENFINAGSEWESAGSTDANSRIPTDCTFASFPVWFLVLFFQVFF